MAQYEREMISMRTRNALQELKKTKKLGNEKNLTQEGRKMGTAAVIQQKKENENWNRAKLFIEHFQLKNGYMNLSVVSNLLNEQGYKTRNGCKYSPATVRRLIGRTSQ
jgi:DNA invertase Pin-like site-specific DNA recombinase